MANQFLSLSLFLMLLSFFIVLNSVSEFEENRAVPAALNSLTLAFSSQLSTPQDNPSATPSLHPDKRGGDSLEAIEGLFNAHIAGFEAKRNRLGTMLHMQLPMQRFENAVDETDFADAGFSDTQQTFATTLVTALRSAENDNPYRIDMVFNIPEDPTVLSQSQPDEFMQALRRVSTLATTLENKGIPKKMISAGLKTGQTGFVDLYFYRYEPFELPSNNNGDALDQDGGQ